MEDQVVKLFDKKVSIRKHYCRLNKDNPIEVDKPYVNIYVRINKRCNAFCPFCVYQGIDIGFDFFKFENILKHILKKVQIRKLSFTGGEPTILFSRLSKALLLVKNYSKNTFVVVNTNGFNLPLLDNCACINSISLSRHHWSIAKNQQIFGTVSVNKGLFSFKDKHKLHLSCNLIKGQIDSKEQILKYLEMANAFGVRDVGFVTLMKVNNFCEEHHVDFNSLSLEDEYLIVNKNWEYKDTCRCRNYLYLPKTGKKPVKVYSRYAVKQDKCSEGVLVFDGEYLRQGFNGSIIY